MSPSRRIAREHIPSHPHRCRIFGLFCKLCHAMYARGHSTGNACSRILAESRVDSDFVFSPVCKKWPLDEQNFDHFVKTLKICNSRLITRIDPCELRDTALIGICQTEINNARHARAETELSPPWTTAASCCYSVLDNALAWQ